MTSDLYVFAFSRSRLSFSAEPDVTIVPAEQRFHFEAFNLDIGLPLRILELVDLCISRSALALILGIKILQEAMLDAFRCALATSARFAASAVKFW